MSRTVVGDISYDRTGLTRRDDVMYVWRKRSDGWIGYFQRGWGFPPTKRASSMTARPLQKRSCELLPMSALGQKRT